MGIDRGSLLHNVDDALTYHKLHAKERESNQVSLFSVMNEGTSLPTLRFKPAPEISQEDKLAWEKDRANLIAVVDEHRQKQEAGINTDDEPDLHASN